MLDQMFSFMYFHVPLDCALLEREDQVRLTPRQVCMIKQQLQPQKLSFLLLSKKPLRINNNGRNAEQTDHPVARGKSPYIFISQWLVM
jgi:hypothetical protein